MDLGWLRKAIREWRLGLAIIAIIMVSRALGVLQSLELFMLDIFLKTRYTEGMDPYITIVAVDESYLEENPSSESKKLYDLIAKLYTYNPAAVGLDSFLDSIPQTTQSQFASLFRAHPTFIGVEKLLPPNRVLPPSTLTPEEVRQSIGFNDLAVDVDGNVRRIFLGVSPTGAKEEFKESFALKLAKNYLESYQNIQLQNGRIDPTAMRFGATEIPRIHQSWGGYGWQPVDGIQTLINFRMGDHPFNIIPASEVMNQEFEGDDLSDRIVLVGLTNANRGRTLPTIVTISPFLNDLGPAYKGQILGIEFQAHAISQILNAALSDRPLIWTFPWPVEYLLIFSLGLGGILVGKVSTSIGRNLIVLIMFNTVLWTLSYGILVTTGLWLPILPTFMAFSTTGLAFIAFYQNERTWRALVLERDQALQALAQEGQRSIEKAFSTIHAGPLQTLAGILRELRDGNHHPQHLITSLELLNREIREVGEHLREETITQENRLYLQGGIRLDMAHPLHELFYEVYNATLAQTYPGFRDIKIRTVSFEPFSREPQNVDTRRNLCQFLAEALCNVGKHAIGTTRLTVIGKLENNSHILRITDNGPGLSSHHIGDGTTFCRNVAKRLQGTFSRYPAIPKGITCELSCPIELLEKSSSEIVKT